MNLGNITLITPPDRLFNNNLSYLLVKPSNLIKGQFQTILSQSPDDLNVYIFDNDDTDIAWLLSVVVQVDCVIVDIDNCDPTTHKFVSVILANSNSHYLTKDDTTPYHLVSRNRIYDLNSIVEQIIKQEEDEDDEPSQD
jgi:hypothetical protein